MPFLILRTCIDAYAWLCSIIYSNPKSNLAIIIRYRTRTPSLCQLFPDMLKEKLKNYRWAFNAGNFAQLLNVELALFSQSRTSYHAVYYVKPCRFLTKSSFQLCLKVASTVS